VASGTFIVSSSFPIIKDYLSTSLVFNIRILFLFFLTHVKKKKKKGLFTECTTAFNLQVNHSDIIQCNYKNRKLDNYNVCKYKFSLYKPIFLWEKKKDYGAEKNAHISMTLVVSILWINKIYAESTGEQQ
jgi:hypothetical protein